MYPSKSDGMFVPESLIFRSDSNGEDLKGYAGAGLYDSITMDRTELRKVDYASDRSALHPPVLLLLCTTCAPYIEGEAATRLLTVCQCAHSRTVSC